MLNKTKTKNGFVEKLSEFETESPFGYREKRIIKSLSTAKELILLLNENGYSVRSVNFPAERVIQINVDASLSRQAVKNEDKRQR